jgi:hypothetical protein
VVGGTIHPSPGGFPRGRPALNHFGVSAIDSGRSAAISGGSTAVSGGSAILLCSAKGCRAAAIWALRWNNPKLHQPERRKTWLACAEHRDSLSAFLSARGFLREVTPVEADPGPDPAGSPPAVDQPTADVQSSADGPGDSPAGTPGERPTDRR